MDAENPDMSDILASIDHWEADNVGAAVFDGGGVLAAHGERSRATDVASVTKLVTAWAALVAVEEGSVSLEDEVGPAGSTLRHLLTHASGLPFEGREPIAAAGTRRIYSNSGYELIAAHLEARTDIALSDYATEAVLKPLGMGSTTFEGGPASGMRSCVDDLVRLGMELLSPHLIHESTWNSATRPVLPDLSGVVPGWGQQNPCPWGLGPEITGSKSPHWTGTTAAPETFGHFGAAGSFLWVDPGSGVGCAVVTDRPFGDWAVEVWPGFNDAIRARLSGFVVRRG